MSDNLPWKTWTPDDLAPPQAEFVPMVEPEETIIEEAEPSLEQQLAQLQMQAHEQGYQAGIAEGRQQGHEQGTFLTGLHVELDVVVQEVAHQTTVQHRGIRTDLAVIGRDRHNLAAAQPFRNGGAFDAVVADFVQKLGIPDMARTGAASGVKLFEHREQHPGDDQPYGNF